MFRSFPREHLTRTVKHHSRAPCLLALRAHTHTPTHQHRLGRALPVNGICTRTHVYVRCSVPNPTTSQKGTAKRNRWATSIGSTPSGRSHSDYRCATVIEANAEGHTCSAPVPLWPIAWLCMLYSSIIHRWCAIGKRRRSAMAFARHALTGVRMHAHASVRLLHLGTDSG